MKHNYIFNVEQQSEQAKIALQVSIILPKIKVYFTIGSILIEME
jgi:hypothetical protein